MGIETSIFHDMLSDLTIKDDLWGFANLNDVGHIWGAFTDYELWDCVGCVGPVVDAILAHNLSLPQMSHVQNVLHPGTKEGNAYAIAYVLLTRAQVLLTRISCLARLTLAYAGLRAPQFAYAFRTWLRYVCCFSDIRTPTHSRYVMIYICPWNPETLEFIKF